jgi:integrase
VNGSIRLRGDAWQLRVYEGTGPDGRKRYVSRTVRGTRADAEAELGRLVSLVRDTSTSPVHGTVGELCEKWLAYASRNLAPAVAAEYRRLLDKRIRPRFADTPVNALRPAELDAWYEQLAVSGGANGQGLSANSVNRVHAIVHRALEQGVAWGWIGHNPAHHATPPAVRRRPLHLPRPEDVVVLIDDARHVNRALPVFLRLAAITGARRGELCALRWRHIDTTNAMVHIAGAIATTPRGFVEGPTKTHAERRLAIDPTTLELLLSLGPADDESGFVFSHDGGVTPWRPNYVTLAFGRLTRQLGFPDLRLHDLRHFAATTMLLNGVDVRTAAGRLGHARPSTTLDIYAHYTQPADQHAATTLADALDHVTSGSSKHARVVTESGKHA